MIGETLGHYQIVDKLGEGGMGVVYKALDSVLGRFVALKVLLPDALMNPEQKQRFVLEAKTVSALNHPNIVTVYEISEADGVLFIVMEYVSGKTLQKVIEHRRLPVSEALRYAVQMAEGLSAAHSRGIVHRDLKPGNIILNDEGLIKVVDFGLAKFGERIESANQESPTQATRTALTEEGRIVGTVSYMSPEQAEGKPLDSRSDIFAFGAVLYEMLTGEQAFQGKGAISTLAAIILQDPKPVSEILPSLPRELDRVIMRCLRKDPARRYQNINELRITLQDLKTETDSARLLPPQTIRLAKTRAWIGRFARALAIATACVLIAFGLYWWPRNQAPSPPLTLRRLTADAGLTTTPAISRDGKLLAYASDRSGDGNLDIWVQHIGSNDAVRLTRDMADDSEPAISPDGSRIAFRSERNPSGIYLMSSLGGDARLIARDGHGPRFSPNGEWIAYWTGDPQSKTGNRSFVLPSSVGPPRELQPGFLDARKPIWSPDSNFLLFEGARSPTDPSDERVDWWVTPLSGGTGAKRTGIARLLSGKVETFEPGVWSDDDRLIFAGDLGDSRNLWEIGISRRNWRVYGPATQLTFGTGREGQPALSTSGVLVFQSATSAVNVWALRLPTARLRMPAVPERLDNSGICMAPTISADGTTVAFVSSRSGAEDVWIKDLKSNRLTPRGVTGAHPRWPVLSSDGHRIAYMPDTEAARVAVGATTDLTAEEVYQDLGIPQHWAADGKRVLYLSLQLTSLDIFNTVNRMRMELVGSPGQTAMSGRFSPDGRWLVFQTRNEQGQRSIWISRLEDKKLDPAGWIRITDDPTDLMPRWSPDGNGLYFISDRDGFRCIWTVELDPATKVRLGEPRAFYHAHNGQQSLRVGSAGFNMEVAKDKLVVNMDEFKGNLWGTNINQR
jgi:serine/threonine protein kinase